MTAMLSSFRAARVRDIAAGWLMRREEGLSSKEEAALDAWLARSAEHERIFHGLAESWALLDALEHDPEIRGWGVSVPDERPGPTEEHTVRSQGWRALVAACLVLGISLGVVGSYSGVFRRADMERPDVFSSAKGQRVEVALADGSRIMLDADSRLAVQFTSSRRSIALERGRAYFRVAHDTSRPFVVTAGAREVVAVGTEFDVSREGAGMSVALSQGKVLVRPSATSAATRAPARILRVGEELRYSPKAGTLVDHVDMGVATSWRDGILTFNEVPLADAVSAFNRYSSRPIELANPALGKLAISGTFSVGAAEQFANTLGTVLPVEARVEAGRILILPARQVR